MIKCPHCGYKNRKTAQFCQGCGATLPDRNLSIVDTQPVVISPQGQRPSPMPPSDTRPLAITDAAFTPLPEGALLNRGRYAILELLGSNKSTNAYLAEGITRVRVCANCQKEITNSREQFCSFCGADISAIEPLHRRYRVHESADQTAVAVKAQLLGMDLRHPGLMLPCDVFVEAPYGSPRGYLVEAELEPPLASSLHVPQELAQVLEWGVSLAQAMNLMHSRHIALREVGLKQIAIQHNGAQWTRLDAAAVISSDSHPLAANYFAQDVRGLASALAYLATGPRRDIRAHLPEQTARAFSQALSESAGLTAGVFASALEHALYELRQPNGITLMIGQSTDVGQERSLNEDSLLALTAPPAHRSTDTEVGVFAVADGMGGHAAGDVASRVAVETIQQHTASEILALAAAGETLPSPREWLVATTMAANQRVYEQRRAAGTDMGTTLVMALVIRSLATIANVGDSRAYLLTPETISQITIDHSLVERLVATGQITREEAARHPQRSVIYRVIGDKPQTEVDLFTQPLRPGEALLLCSDGLSGMVPDEQILHIWQSAASPQETCDRLIEAANKAGGMDNITAVIVQIAGSGSD
jgi:serine/threonine protein phosphatase PrpC